MPMSSPFYYFPTNGSAVRDPDTRLKRGLRLMRDRDRDYIQAMTAAVLTFAVILIAGLVLVILSTY